MTERQPGFSDHEKEEIASQARALAEVGENAVWDLVRVRLVFKQASFLCAKNQKDFIFEFEGGEKVTLTKEQVDHEADVIGEVIRQARIILQIEGRDEISIMDKHLQEAGMGSIFDPESEAFKKVGYILIE